MLLRTRSNLLVMNKSSEYRVSRNAIVDMKPGTVLIRVFAQYWLLIRLHWPSVFFQSHERIPQATERIPPTRVPTSRRQRTEQ